MAARLAAALPVLAALLAGCGGPPPAPGGADATEALRADDAAGFERAYAPRPFSFPADHGPHQGFRDEWWYLTGNLDGPEGRRFGFQLTFFRHGLERVQPARDSRWAFRDAAMAHFAITDAGGGRHLAFQRTARLALGLAGAEAQPFKVWLDDWHVEAAPGGGFPWRLRARQDGAALELELSPQKPPVPNGEEGLSRKSAEPGNASYYYSITRLAAKGSLTLDGQARPVSGLAWLDREWGTSMLAENQAGWDWFALQLDDGADLMYYRLRGKDGSDAPESAGGLVAKDGVRTPLARADVALDAWDTWESPEGVRYPAGWRLQAAGRSLKITPVLADQEFRHDIRYWEGAVDVTDAATGKPAGRGYVELTGYAPKTPR